MTPNQLQDRVNKSVSIFIVVLIALLILGNAFLWGSDGVVYDTEYCTMTKLWEDNSHVPKERRIGWPPYKGPRELHCGGQ